VDVVLHVACHHFPRANANDYDRLRARAGCQARGRGSALKVAFDTRPLSEADGIGRYSRCLLSALRELSGDGDELIETNRPATTMRAGDADVLHAPWMEGAMLRSPCPAVVTVHDLTKRKRRSEHLRTGLRQRLRDLAVQRAMRVVVPTRSVADDAVEQLGVERRRVVVIPHAADPAMRPRGDREVAAVRERFKLPERYLVWVGALRHPDPTKHVRELAAAPRRLPLVMVGPTQPWAHELPEVTLTGQVSDEHLAAIYSGAHALVLSSEGEGFGFPAVEALACGTPVTACSLPALAEVLGERATFVPQGDMRSLVMAAEAATRPAPAPPPWTWQDAARATWAAYSSALAEAADQRNGTRPARRRSRRPGVEGA
jgi:glycosyltransferase involved in cell wall biosynthesis